MNIYIYILVYVYTYIYAHTQTYTNIYRVEGVVGEVGARLVDRRVVRGRLPPRHVDRLREPHLLKRQNPY